MLYEIITILLGIIFLIYYLCICFVMGKWNTTFSRFWLVSGILMIGIHFLRTTVVDALLLFAIIVYLIIELQIIKAMFPKIEKDLPYIIVLGAKVNGTVVSESLRRRLDAASEYLQGNPDTRVIVSGSKLHGEEITEAEAMMRYLVDKGIKENRILKEENSYTTKQNLMFSMELMDDKAAAVGIVTSNYHIYRSLAYARCIGYKKIYGIPASCHPVLFINYITREFFALVKIWLTKDFTML